MLSSISVHRIRVLLAETDEESNRMMMAGVRFDTGRAIEGAIVAGSG